MILVVEIDIPCRTPAAFRAEITPAGPDIPRIANSTVSASPSLRWRAPMQVKETSGHPRHVRRAIVSCGGKGDLTTPSSSRGRVMS